MPSLTTAYADIRLRCFIPFAVPGVNPWSYRRRGFEFGKEPIDLTMGELADNLMDALEAVIEIGRDAQLSSALVMVDGTERVLDEETLAAIETDLSAMRAAHGSCPHCGKVIE